MSPCSRMNDLHRFIRQYHSAGEDKFVVIADYCTFCISIRKLKTPERQVHVIRTSTIYMVAPKK